MNKYTEAVAIEAGHAGGVLLVGFRTSTVAAFAGEQRIFAPDAFIRIDRPGKVTLIMLHVEMGQGGYTSIAMILAEELDAAIDQVLLEAAAPNDRTLWQPRHSVFRSPGISIHSRLLVTLVQGVRERSRCPDTPLRKSGMSSHPQSARKMATPFTTPPHGMSDTETWLIVRRH
jgi:hypothetical protein